MSNNDAVLVSGAFEEYKKNISKDVVDESNMFEVFAVDSILKDYDLAYSEIIDGITGGGGDGGIDATYMFVNGELISEDTDLSPYKKDIGIEIIIFQSKNSSSFKESAIDKLSSSFNDLLNLSKNLDDLFTVYNYKIIYKFNIFRDVYKKLARKFPTMEFRIYYVTNCPEMPHDNVFRKANRLEEDIKEKYFSGSDTSFIFVDAKYLLENIRRNQKTTLSLKYIGTPLISPFGEAYICLVNIKNYVDFITDDKGRLRKSIFEANVRDYQGNSQVNEQIRETLTINNKDDFWWLNNGITMLSTKALIADNSLLVENPQIVNGLQTSTELSTYAKKANIDSDNRNILVRVVKTSDDDRRNRIIKATNSQTNMPYASLRATDKIHSDIEDHFNANGLYYDRRKNFYKNEGKSARDIVSISSLAQSVISTILLRPNDARGRPTTLLKDDENYKAIFSDSYPLDMYLNCIRLRNKVDLYLSTLSDAKDRNNCRFYALMLLSMKSCKSTNVDAKKMAAINIEEVSQNDVVASILFSLYYFKELGGTDNVAKGKDLIRKLKEVSEKFVKLDSELIMKSLNKTPKKETFIN